MPARAGSTPPEARRQAGLSTVALAGFGLRRHPPRAPADRQPGYLDLFDFDTLFYDAFRATDPRHAVLIGPPLLNCQGLLDGLTFRLPDRDDVVAWDYLPNRSIYQPNFRIRLSHPSLPGADRLLLEAAGQRIEIPIQPNQSSRFAGRRVILTLSKDNPLPWISDWVEFNTRVHQADAVLVYDNGSTAYCAEELQRHLSSLPGLATAMVVPWPFPYGPGVGPRNLQDSFYCQPAALEHARWRYCAEAAGVLNNDIDELTVPPPGDSIFGLLERSGRAAIVYPGLWAEGPFSERTDALALRHRDIFYSERWRSIIGRAFPRRWLLRTKWVAQPARCPDETDWGVHDIYPRQAQSASQEALWKLRTTQILYRHFRLLSAKPGRKRIPRRSALTSTIDRPLARCLAIGDGGLPVPATGLGARLAWLLRQSRSR